MILAAGKGGVTVPSQVVVWAIILLVVYLIGRKHGGS
jgi:hypothetical protein